METDLQDGLEVHAICPDAGMKFSDVRWQENYEAKLPAERSRFSVGRRLLSKRIASHLVSDLASRNELFSAYQAMQYPAFKSADELDQFQFAAHDCGNGVRSSLISHLRDTNPDVLEHSDWIARALDASILVYLAARTFIQEQKPERVYVYNARMSTFRGVLRAAQELGVECVVHERGATLERISLSKNTMPHDIYWVQREIETHWQAEQDENKTEIGNRFYQKKREKHVFNWYAYTAQQREDWLPPEIEQASQVYSIFTSSEFERFALPQYYNYLMHESQLQGIIDVISVLKDGGFGGALAIRIHPNSHNEKPDLESSLRKQIDEEFVHILSADSPADTYALIDRSEKVITFGTTVAMEAAYWGKPSISFATNPYEALDAIYQPRSRDEARQMLLEPLAAKGLDDCIKYGFYYSTFGRELKYSTVEDMFNLRFKGNRIRESLMFRKLFRPYLSFRNRFQRAA